MIQNLYRHADGDYYCLLSNETAGKSGEEWESGVTYAGVDGQMRWTTTNRWNRRFTSVADYTGDDDQVWAMIRRCNPEEIDSADIWAAWHDSETAINAEVLELVMAASLASGLWSDPELPKREVHLNGARVTHASLTIGPRHLQWILQNYTVERETAEDGYRVTIRK